MVTEEKIAELEETVSAWNARWEAEQEMAERMRSVCAKEAQVISEMNADWLCLALSETEGGQRGCPKEVEGLRELWKDPAVWPHLGGGEAVHLRDQLRESQFEIKWIENKMYDSARARLRKLSVRLEKEQERLSQLEQAQKAVDFWEDLYVMFMEDRERRRSSWMDEQFYEMERRDICRKMESCRTYCAGIGKMVEEGLLLNGRRAGASLKEIPPELREEIEYYSVGVLFLENHLYNCVQAAKERTAAARELERLRSREK